VEKEVADKKCCADCIAYIVPSGHNTTPFKLTSLCKEICKEKVDIKE